MRETGSKKYLNNYWRAQLRSFDKEKDKQWGEGYSLTYDFAYDTVTRGYSLGVLLYPTDSDDIHLEQEYNPVYADTIGAFIGLTDKSKKPIFEDDIIKYTGKFSTDYYIVVWDSEAACFALSGYDNCIVGDFTFFVPERCEIVGNVHDNADLRNEILYGAHRK